MLVGFAFDFISPYAYLGWHRAREALAGVATLEPIPVLFAAMLDANGTRGPAEIPAKRIYTWKHVLRLAHTQGVTIAPPPAHPFNPLLGLRLIASDVAAALDPEQRGRALEVLYAMTWGGGPGITDPEVVAEHLEAAGLPGKTLVEATAEPTVKQRVKDNTARAIAQGVFGVPSYLVPAPGDAGEDDAVEVFWGQDSVPDLVRYLRGEDPIDRDALERWKNLPAAAMRKGARVPR